VPSYKEQGTYFGNLQYYKYYILPTAQRLFGKSSKKPKNKHSEMVLNLLELFALQGTSTTWQLAKIRLSNDISALRTREKEYRRLLVGREDRGKHYPGLLELGLVVKDGFNFEKAPANKYRLSLHGMLYSIDIIDFNETYYLGWTGSLKGAAELYPTKYPIPNNFDIIESKRGEGDILILLSKFKNTDGYSGYTKSTVDGNEILKISITIYDVNNLSKSQLSTIIRHEMGHALGLAHSTAPEDLMAAKITTNFPYISECDVSAIAALYNGNIEGQVTCEK